MLEQLFKIFCKEKRIFEGKSELTIKSYRQALNRYLNTSPDEPPTQISLKTFVIAMRESGLQATVFHTGTSSGTGRGFVNSSVFPTARFIS
jgi:hypothetical protein